MEDWVQEKLLDMQIAGFGRTPGDKREASQMTSAWNDITRALKKIVPWTEERRKQEIRERLKKPPKSRVVEVEGELPESVKSALGLS